MVPPPCVCCACCRSPDPRVLSSLQVPEVHSPVLEHLVVMQMDSFPQYSPKMQLVCCRAIVRLFLALAEKGPILWSCIGAMGEYGVYS